MVLQDHSCPCRGPYIHAMPSVPISVLWKQLRKAEERSSVARLYQRKKHNHTSLINLQWMSRQHQGSETVAHLPMSDQVLLSYQISLLWVWVCHCALGTQGLCPCSRTGVWWTLLQPRGHSQQILMPDPTWLTLENFESSKERELHWNGRGSPKNGRV